MVLIWALLVVAPVNHDDAATQIVKLRHPLVPPNPFQTNWLTKSFSQSFSKSVPCLHNRNTRKMVKTRLRWLRWLRWLRVRCVTSPCDPDTHHGRTTRRSAWRWAGRGVRCRCGRGWKMEWNGTWMGTWMGTWCVAHQRLGWFGWFGWLRRFGWFGCQCDVIFGCCGYSKCRRSIVFWPIHLAHRRASSSRWNRNRNRNAQCTRCACCTWCTWQSNRLRLNDLSNWSWHGLTRRAVWGTTWWPSAITISNGASLRLCKTYHIRRLHMKFMPFSI